MDSEKKRPRPTWAMVRELEQHISALVDEKEMLEEENARLTDEVLSMRRDEGLALDRCSALEQSNKTMEDELKRLRSVIDDMDERCREKDGIIFRLMHRGLVGRILNREA